MRQDIARRVASRFVKRSGIFAYPPKMFEDIAVWIQAQIYAREIAQLEKRLIRIKRDISKSQAKYLSEEAIRLQKEIDEKKADMQSYEMVPVTEWKKVERTFRLNLEGFRYLEDFKRRFPTTLAKILKTWKFKVVLTTTEGETRWSESQRKLVVSVDEFTPYEDWSSALQHELMHLAQSFMTAIHEFKVQPGMPSPRLQEKNNGDSRSRDIYEHSLADTEFYPDIQTEVNDLSDILRAHDLSEADRRTAIGFYVGALPYDEAIENLNSAVVRELRSGAIESSFRVLLERNPSKWKIAVRELYKALNLKDARFDP